ncbi:MAG: hypothetical protein HY682_00365 [Chloroflexi bacterium]|nr:hypothetical protein [Chloroflexota bacterium]
MKGSRYWKLPAVAAVAAVAVADARANSVAVHDQRIRSQPGKQRRRLFKARLVRESAIKDRLLETGFETAWEERY